MTSTTCSIKICTSSCSILSTYINNNDDDNDNDMYVNNKNDNIYKIPVVNIFITSL